MNALMGYVHDVLNAAIMEADIPLEARTKAIRAFSKLLWIQADLITRHYTHGDEAQGSPAQNSDSTTTTTVNPRS
jgi:hypothetical protein